MNVGELPPMMLGREIDNPRFNGPFEQIRAAQTDLAFTTATFEVLEHFRKPLLELEGDALAHNAHAIDRVDPGLCFRFKEVSKQNANHGDLEKNIGVTRDRLRMSSGSR